MNSLIARRFIIKGRVQGVNYRRFAAFEASALGIDGYAKNLNDGDVEVVAEGMPENIDLLASKLSKGPPAAKVDKITAKDVGRKGYQGFTIK